MTEEFVSRIIYKNSNGGIMRECPSCKRCVDDYDSCCGWEEPDPKQDEQDEKDEKEMLACFGRLMDCLDE